MPQMSDEEMMEAVMGSTGDQRAAQAARSLWLVPARAELLSRMRPDAIQLAVPSSVPVAVLECCAWCMPFAEGLVNAVGPAAGPRKVAAGKVRRKRGSRGLAELVALQR